MEISVVYGIFFCYKENCFFEIKKTKIQKIIQNLAVFLKCPVKLNFYGETLCFEFIQTINGIFRVSGPKSQLKIIKSKFLSINGISSFENNSKNNRFFSLALFPVFILLNSYFIAKFFKYTIYYKILKENIEIFLKRKKEMNFEFPVIFFKKKKNLFFYKI